MDSVGIAVVGAGYWGPNLIRNFRASPRTALRWVIDADEQRARDAVGEQSDIRIGSSIDEVLADDQVDGVALVTPPATHHELAMRCFEAGKHVLAEKPIATTVAEAEQMLAVAAERDLVLMSDHTFCYTAPVRKLRELVDSGELGDLYYFDSVRINLGLVQSQVNVFWDLAPHDISILDYVLPPGVTMTAVAAQASDPIGLGQAAIGYLTITLSNGALAHVHVNWLSPSKVRTTILGGSKKMVIWDDLHPAERVKVYDSGVEVADDLEERRRLLVSYRAGDVVSPSLDSTEALHLVVEEFADAITEGRTPLTDGRAGLQVVRVLEAVDRSLAEGGASIPLDGG